MDSPSLKRRLTCILATDAVGYSRLVNENEGNALRVLAAHRAVIDGIIAFHDGRIVSTAGDSVLAEFRSVVDAVRCAVEIQDALRTRNESLPEGQRMLFRIGINLGEVVVRGDDLLGDGVNVAARLESLAQPGGILISSSVYDQITGKLDLGFQDIGEQALKNISRPIRAFRVSGAGGTIRAEPPSRAEPKSAPSRGVMIGAIALVAVAGGAAWTQGWIGGPRASSVEVAAADPVKTKLEADLAASEKRRVEAEKLARTADAAAASARAEAEAAARRARAEADGVLIRAKAQAEAAAMRSQATQAQEANRAKAAEADAIKARAETEAAALRSKAESEAAALKEKAESEAAALKVKAQLDAAAAQAEAASAAKMAAAAAAQARAEAAGDDGAWVATYKCSAVGRQAPFTVSGGIFVRGSEFRVERGVPGERGYNVASGRPAADGTLVMTGNGLSGVNGQPFDIRFDGRRIGDRYMLQGAFGGRTCDVEFARPGAGSKLRG